MDNEIKVLTSQVNPHFLFNSLNTLITLIPEDKETAIRFTQKLSDVYRYVLQGKNKDLISLEEEISFLENYIFLLKIRYGSNLIIEKKVEPEALLRQLPVLSSQLIIENAIKHNTISASKPLRIGITANQNWLTIVNNRNEKLVAEPGTGTGLENIRKRYALYSNDDIQVEDTREYFSVRIPLLKVARYESIDH
jgi:LytS/YehU family sensor histidine kinase